MNNWTGLYEYVRRRGGVVCLDDGPRFGISKDTLRKRAKREGWRNRYPRRGVFFLPGCDGSLRAEASAALLAVGSPVWLARETAAVFWGLSTLLNPLPIRVLVPHGQHRYNAPGFALHESRRITEADVTVLDDLPITVPARTIADHCAVHGLTRCRNMAIAGFRLGLLVLTDLQMQHDAMGRGAPGRSRLGHIIRDLARSPIDSGFEFRVRAFLASHSIILYPGPFPYLCRDGVIVHLDIVIAGVCVYVECDSFGIHTKEAVFSKDRVRWNQITHDWRPVWVDEDRLENDPQGFLRDVQEAIAAVQGKPQPAPADCRCHRCRP